MFHRAETKKWRTRLQLSDITLISQNCIGGCIYHDLGLEFSSPTINLFIEGEDFCRFVENLKYYLNVPAKEAGYRQHATSGKVYPLITVSDVLVHALHYESCENAVSAWNRRSRRSNLDNVYVIANSWNLLERRELIYRILKTPYPKVVFSDIAYDDENVFVLSDDVWRRDEGGIVRPDLTSWSESGFRYYEQIFDFVGWINDPKRPPISYINNRNLLKQ